mmetsp:Transcript_76297/g.114859  ORF Transcript_76297/g.114859 Transcript_76297/m.114859 type:complete len:253 (+) Transcript_76297:713-1471(+)
MVRHWLVGHLRQAPLLGEVALHLDSLLGRQNAREDDELGDVRLLGVDGVVGNVQATERDPLEVGDVVSAESTGSTTKGGGFHVALLAVEPGGHATLGSTADNLERKLLRVESGASEATVVAVAECDIVGGARPLRLHGDETGSMVAQRPRVAELGEAPDTLKGEDGESVRVLDEELVVESVVLAVEAHDGLAVERAREQGGSLTGRQLLECVLVARGVLPVGHLLLTPQSREDGAFVGLEPGAQPGHLVHDG